MPKSPPDRLAAALRANLKRRKGASAVKALKKDPESAPKDPQKPPKNSG